MDDASVLLAADSSPVQMDTAIRPPLMAGACLIGLLRSVH
jgi:hypothetical protein